jgi:hypothetical protein
MNDDGDIVKAIGYMTLYGAYLEEQIESLVELLTPIIPYTGGWPISSKIKHAIACLKVLNGNEVSSLVTDLGTCVKIFNDRNELVHGRIYAGIGRPDTLTSSKASVPDRIVTSKEIYQLVNEMEEFRVAIYGPTIFKIPSAIHLALNNRA